MPIALSTSSGIVGPMSWKIHWLVVLVLSSHLISIFAEASDPTFSQSKAAQKKLFKEPKTSVSNQASPPIGLTADQWVVLSYQKIPKSTVTFGSSLKIDVASSAGPIVHRLAVPKRVTGFKVLGSWQGQKSVESSAFDEDSVLRMGFVGEGTQTLGWIQKKLAAPWVLELFKLGEGAKGLDKIYFYNLTNRPPLIGKERAHPKSDLILERVVQVLDQPGKFQFEYNLTQPIQTLGLWLSADGDDTQSKFMLQIDSIELKM